MKFQKVDGLNDQQSENDIFHFNMLPEKEIF